MKLQILGYIASILGPIGSGLLATNRPYRWTGFVMHMLGSICWLIYAGANGITPLILSGIAFIIVEGIGSYRHYHGIGEKKR